MHTRLPTCILFFLAALSVSPARGQSPEGYWIGDGKSGYFQGVDDMEMRVDRASGGLKGNIYYIWEHGYYYQDISLEGSMVGGDSLVLTERVLVDNRNGDIQGNCFGSFRLAYTRDQTKEYLTGIWIRPPGLRYTCPDSKVSFFRLINHAGSPLPPRAATRPAPAKVSAPPVVKRMAIDEDSSRLQAFHSRKDSLEQVIPHRSDTARLELYDDGVIDHDRISLFLGDSLILRNYELLAHAREVILVLDPRRKDNVLSLYAENEGDIPPNTALMVIYVDEQRYEVRLSSDMETNARVVFQKITP